MLSFTQAITVYSSKGKLFNSHTVSISAPSKPVGYGWSIHRGEIGERPPERRRASGGLRSFCYALLCGFAPSDSIRRSTQFKCGSPVAVSGPLRAMRVWPAIPWSPAPKWLSHKLWLGSAALLPFHARSLLARAGPARAQQVSERGWSLTLKRSR